MTTATDVQNQRATQELELLRTAQTLLTAAIQHAREEALEPHWSDQLLGLRLRLEKASVAAISRELDQMERSR